MNNNKGLDRNLWDRYPPRNNWGRQHEQRERQPYPRHNPLRKQEPRYSYHIRWICWRRRIHVGKKSPCVTNGILQWSLFFGKTHQNFEEGVCWTNFLKGRQDGRIITPRWCPRYNIDCGKPCCASDPSGQRKLTRYIVLASAPTNEDQPRHDETDSHSISRFRGGESSTNGCRYAPGNC